MTTPVSALLRPKVPTSILGTRPSKTCQKEIIPMKGSAATAQRLQSNGTLPDVRVAMPASSSRGPPAAAPACPAPRGRQAAAPYAPSWPSPLTKAT